ncbi:response regulator transcription factor [Neobacillus dielmonensis]|uniref:response regulator transcription factor n=1 Tax=Neobacillus dielmonensis TaxID=1347369 RepID=UPI00069337B7|nr:LuxR C-terminal-related transcriptional regulator [Neobacillus dielmonensis]
MVVSIKDQMNQLFRLAGLEIYKHQKEIKQEWENMIKGLNQRKALIDVSPEEQLVLLHLNQLFWNMIPKFNTGDLNTILQQLRSDWENLNSKLQPHKLMLLFTLLEQITQKIIKTNDKADIHLHQSIQHFFSLVLQNLLVENKSKYLTFEDFFSKMGDTKDGPLLWFAKLLITDKGASINHFKANTSLEIDETYEKIVSSLQGPSIDLLSEAIMRLISDTLPEDELEVATVVSPTECYLYCLTKSDGEKFKPVINLLLHMFKENEKLSEVLEIKNDWKDSLILFDEWIMLARNFKEAIESVVGGFTKYLPFERAALFYYTKTETGEDIGMGVMGHKIATKEIRNIRENLVNLPQITKTMLNIQPLYLPKAKVVLPSRFVQQFRLESLVIIPIYSAFNQQILGAVFLDQGEGEMFSISNAMLSVITKFGQHAGEILAKYTPEKDYIWPISNKTLLSNREIEILKLIADGKTIDEAADLLFLSKYTVRDYISIIKKKLNAQNRTQAIAEAIRQGFI